MGMAPAVVEWLSPYVELALAWATGMTYWLLMVRPLSGRQHVRKVDREADEARAAVLGATRHVRAAVPSGRVLEADAVQLSDGSACGAAHKRLFVFFPGNPGALGFYSTLIKAVRDRSEGPLHVCAIGHAGHAPHHKGSRKVSLEDQVDHKIAVLRALYPWIEDDDSEVFVSGHSVGSYVGLQVMARWPEVNWSAFFGLCPTVVHIATSPNGQRLTPLLSSAPLRTVVVAGVGVVTAAVRLLLPRRALFWIVKRAMKNDCPDVDDHFVPLAYDVIDPFAVENLLHMACDEMHSIKGVAPIQHLIDSHGKHMHFVLSPVDEWCHGDIVDQMHELFPEAKFHTMPQHVGHAFCLSHDAVNQVLAHVVPLL